jgi:hypothetical protein
VYEVKTRESCGRIDYLAKDFDTFKDIMISTIENRVFGWKPTSEADLDLVLIELLCAAADELSDYQDRVMNEAYINTARKRVSVARHARLIDYYICQGHQPNTWLAIELKPGEEIKLDKSDEIKSSLRVKTSTDPRTNTVYSTRGNLSFMSHLLNRFTLYTWNGANKNLKAGDTSADLRFVDKSLCSKDAYKELRRLIIKEELTTLLIQEWKHPISRKELKDTRRKSNRQLLRLLSNEENAKVNFDPISREYCLHVTWDKRDQLKHDYQFVIDNDEGPITDATQFHGNLVRVYYGETKRVRFVDPNNCNIANENEYYYQRTKWGTICRIPDYPVSYIDVYEGKTPNGKIPPRTTLTVKVNGVTWKERIDLIHSREDDCHFIVETDEHGKSIIRFGNGINGKKLPQNAAVRCDYQVGIGRGGNIGSDTLNVINEPFKSQIISCWNPFQVTNGREAETMEEIRSRLLEVYPKRKFGAFVENEKMGDHQNAGTINKEQLIKSINAQPRLSKFVYGLGTYSTFKEAFLKLLDSQQGFSLRGWTYRGSDNPAIAIMEGASILCDILEFYQNLYANEAYLRTARQRRSLIKLKELKGYRSILDLVEESLHKLEITGTKIDSNGDSKGDSRVENSKKNRVRLYERLPAIYRERDQKQEPPYQLKAYLEIFEKIFGEIHENIESLYNDLFIETCGDWAIPYIGNLYGVSCPKSNPWTCRKCIAETIKVRSWKRTKFS